jgi:hypothetical protein
MGSITARASALTVIEEGSCGLDWRVTGSVAEAIADADAVHPRLGVGQPDCAGRTVLEVDHADRRCLVGDVVPSTRDASITYPSPSAVFSMVPNLMPRGTRGRIYCKVSYSKR